MDTGPYSMRVVSITIPYGGDGEEVLYTLEEAVEGKEFTQSGQIMLSMSNVDVRRLPMVGSRVIVELRITEES